MAWWVTTYITFERCLCIVMPLKVKHYVTPRGTVLVMVGIYVVVLGGSLSVAVCHMLVPVYFPQLNRTIVIKAFRENGLYMETVGFYVFVSIQCGAILTNAVLTAIIIKQLRVKSKWREVTSHTAGPKDRLSLRDRKLVKMVTFMSCIFIGCVTPSLATFLTITTLTYSFVYSMRYYNVFVIVWAVVYVFETTNSMVNFFVYYNMSAKFKATYNAVFWTSKLEKDKKK